MSRLSLEGVTRRFGGLVAVDDVSFEVPAEGVTAVAFDCGFNDLSYFYREFRKKYGTTPGAVARCH